MCFDGSKYDHDGIVKRASRLLDILCCTSTKHNSHSFGGTALCEHVKALATELDLLELSADAEDAIVKTINGGLHNCSSRLADTLEIVLWHTTCAENVSICEVLSSKITDWELGEHNAGSRSNNFVKLLVDDRPLGVNDFLEIVGVLETNLSTVLLGFELKLEIEADNLGAVCEALWLLLEASVREGLSEADTLNQERISHGSTSDLLDADVLLVELITD